MNGIKLDDKISDHVFRSPTNERAMEVIKIYCTFFGCGKQLSLLESLYGNRCQAHAGLKPMLHQIDKITIGLCK